MQLCSPTTRTLGSLLTNGVWCGQYGKPFEQALQTLYNKNRSRAGWKRERERVIVCPWLQSGVGFTASYPSFLFWYFFPYFSFFSTCPCFPSSDPSFLSSSLLALSFACLFLTRPSNHPSLLPSLFYFLCVILSASETCYILISMVTYCNRLSLLTHLKTHFTYCIDHFVVLVL